MTDKELKHQAAQYESMKQNAQIVQPGNGIRGAVPSGPYTDSPTAQKEMPVPTEIARLKDRLHSLLNRIQHLEECLHPVLREQPLPTTARVQQDCAGTSQLAGSIYVMSVLVEDMTYRINDLAERVEL